MADADGSPTWDEVQLAAGLSEAQQQEVRGIFAALNATRAARGERTEGPTGDRPLPLCGALMADGTPCLLPAPHGPDHRGEEAPAAVQELVAGLRADLAQAHRVARDLYRALPAETRRDLDDGSWPWWLTADQDGA